MSIDINWETITSGQDGATRAEHIRAFVHDKFQQITLPRFIRSVHVHAFEFGSVCPNIIVKDICDPLPDFYEADDDSDGSDGSHDDQDDPDHETTPREPPSMHNTAPHPHLPESALETQGRPSIANNATLLVPPNTTPPQESAKSFLQSKQRLSLVPALPFGLAEPLAGPFSGTGTPGIPGGTSNLNYFHSHLAGLSGTQTPLAAVASGTPLSSRWNKIEPNQEGYHPIHSEQGINARKATSPGASTGSPPWVSNANAYPSPEDRDILYPPSSPQQQAFASIEGAVEGPNASADLSPPPLRLHPVQPSDLQVVAHVKYSGDVRMILTAEILLDYPMPSFVGIPLKLSITGMTFDGVAILASIRKRAHFCFLSSEDAEALLDAEAGNDERDDDSTRQSGHMRNGAGNNGEKKLRSLLQEIRVESEIGRKENGKQVLKNVGKVEKFVLEQVRRIFEEELVFPSFWTFLV